MDTIDTIGDTQLISSHALSHQHTNWTGQMATIQEGLDPDVAVALLQDTFSGIDYGMALMDEDLDFVLFNEKYAELAFGDGIVPRVGDNAATLAAKQLDTGLYVVPDGLTPDAMALAMAEAVKSCQAEIPLERRDGRHLMASSKRTALGGYLVTVTDVTAEKQAEAAEEDRWTALRSAFNAMEEGVSIWDSEFRFVMCNDNYMKIAAPFTDEVFPVGSPGEEIVAQAYRSGLYDIPDEVTEEDWINLYMDWARNHTGSIETKFKDGRSIVVTAKPTNLGGVLITALDVTEERNTEEKARAMLADAMEALEEGFGLWDSDMRFVMCNQKYLDLVTPFRSKPFEVGTTVADGAREIIQTGLVEFPDGMSEDEIIADIENWVQNFGEKREYHYKDGRIVVLTIQPTDLGGFLITAVDVTEERNSESKARNMLLDAFQAFDEGLVLCDENMNLVFGNDAWKRMNFEGREHLIPEPGTSAIDSVIELVRDGLYAIPDGMTEDDYIAWIMGEMSQHGKQVPVPLADGRHHVGSSHLTAFGGSLLVVRDVTEQKNAEAERLAIEQERHEAEARRMTAVTDAMQTLSNGIVLYDADMNYVMSNDLHDDFWFRGAGIAAAEPGESLRSVVGRLLDADYMLLPEGFSKEDYFEALLTATGNFEKGVTLHSKGGTISANVIKTGLGGYLIEMTNVTEQLAMEAELEQQRETAHQNEKLSALGELLAGVAHELNNPLSVVFGYSQMLQGKIKNPVLSERVDLICQSSERAAKIVRTFLSMARQRPTEMQACSLNEVLKTALEVSSYSLKSNGTIVDVQFDENEPHVYGDYDQLAQVFSNLLVNAGHAVMDKGDAGRITIRSSIDAKTNTVTVEVADNGYGIAPEIQSRIFEPFFTTKDVGEGTGIGLAFSHRIVQGHNGRLTLKSKVGKGTQFFVKFEGIEPTSSAEPKGVSASMTSKKILVVDDEEGVARLIADMLMEEGFDVSKTTSPHDALKLTETEVFDVVLSDFKMPNMNGETFYRAMEKIAPRNAARVGFITGDALGTDVRQFLRSVDRPWIEKPIMRGELLELVDLAGQGRKS